MVNALLLGYRRYLRHGLAPGGGDVSTPICLSVCLFVDKVTQNVVGGFLTKVDE